MTHLDDIKACYDRCGIRYVVRDEALGYQYLFLYGSESRKRFFETTPCEELCRRERFIEFKNGQIASY